LARSRAPTFDAQRDGILERAADLFAEHGFHGASMASIAEASGVSKPLLYHYYRDKSHLLFDIADRYMDRLLDLVAEVRGRGLDPEATFRALVRAFMEAYEHAQSRHRVLVQDVKFLEEDDRARIVARQRQVVDAFAEAIAALRPRLDRRDLRVPLAMILFGMLNWTFTWLRASGPLTYGDMADVVLEIFLDGVRPRG
jgi:AcrR family transcriptional regulator